MTLFTKSDDHALYQSNVDWLIKWCDDNYLIINTVKTEEVIFGKPPNLQLPPVKIHDSDITQVSTYKYLGVMIDQNLTWTDHIDFTCKKIQQRIYFLRRLRSFGASAQIIFLFFTSVIQSVMLYCSTAWYNSLSVKDKAKLQHQIKICSKIIGRPISHLFQEAHNKSMLRLATCISTDITHILHQEYRLLPSNRRFRVPFYNRNRLKHSFIHQSILLLNLQS